ncbi:hypothetical protein J6590_038277 [Homalodisca vitripennis]|nr:hypothetical protein J6590_038277 [Homalodisca vitripennis]
MVFKVVSIPSFLSLFLSSVSRQRWEYISFTLQSYLRNFISALGIHQLHSAMPSQSDNDKLEPNQDNDNNRCGLLSVLTAFLAPVTRDCSGNHWNQ